jgi:hypothetical protein
MRGRNRKRYMGGFRGLTAHRTGRDKGPRSSLATDELQYDFTSMWSSAMLGYIDALPGAESERAVDHGDVQRYASDHGLDMRRHIIGPFDVVDPAGIGRGKAIQCARKIRAHVGIRIFLDDEGRRRMAHEKEQCTIFRVRIGNEPRYVRRDLRESLTTGFNQNLRRRNDLWRNADDR